MQTGFHSHFHSRIAAQREAALAISRHQEAFRKQEVDKTKAEGDGGDESTFSDIPYWMEGNMEMYSMDVLKARQALKADERIRNAGWSCCLYALSLLRNTDITT